MTATTAPATVSAPRLRPGRLILATCAWTVKSVCGRGE